MNTDIEKYGISFEEDDGRRYAAKRGIYISECNDCGQLFLAKTEQCPACGSGDHHDFEDGEEHTLIKRLKNGDRIWE